MADINGVTLNAGSGPTVHYTITYSKSRPNNSQMTYNFTISAALGSSGSYIHSGYALLCTMTVSGSSAQVRIKAADGDDWDGTAPRLRYVSVTCTSTAGNTAQGVRFQVVSDGRLSLSSGVIDNSGYTVQSSELLTKVCGAPTSCSVSSILAEGSVTLSWSGDSGGISNAISSYEIQYSDFTDSSTWGAWAALTTVTTTASSGSVAVAPPPTRGNYRRFQVRTRGAEGASYYSGWKASTNSARRNTAPKPATSAVATPATYSNKTITLTWSGASGGTSAVKGYQIASRTSADNSTWSTWNVLTTLTLSASGGSYNPAVTRGNYRPFRVRTCGAAGESYYSDWIVSGNTVRKNTLPTPPSSFTAAPTIYEGSVVTLTWSGAAPGTSAIKQYVIQRATSTDGTNWSAYEVLTIVVSSLISGTYPANASQIAGTYTRYRINVTDVLDAVSAYVVSGAVKRNSPPTAPTIVCPVSGASSYNTTPRFLIITGVEPDGQSQMVEVKIDAGAWINSVDSPERFSISGYLGNGVKTVFQPQTLAAGSHSITIRCLDSDTASASAEVTRAFTVLQTPFETITANETHVKSAHIQTLRTAVNMA
ncbi:MAG: hypothetical protein ABF904_03035 [Ethanoligenens sp.]